MTKDLVASEKARLADLEQVVERGLQTFHEVGSALLEIREQRLYRHTHSTFETYCNERFGFSDSRGRQLIAAAKTVTAVTERGLPAPKTEREARELARQLRAEADELDGGEMDESEMLSRAAECLPKGNEAMHLAIEEANEAIRAAEGDQAIVHDAEEIIREAYARLEFFEEGKTEDEEDVVARVDRRVRRRLKTLGHPWSSLGDDDRAAIVDMIQTLAREIENGEFPTNVVRSEEQ